MNAFNLFTLFISTQVLVPDYTHRDNHLSISYLLHKKTATIQPARTEGSDPL